MQMTDDELRQAHDDLDGERADELADFKKATVTHMAYLAAYKAAKQALPRRPKDEPVVEDEGEVTA